MQMLSQRYRQLIGRCALLLVAGMALQFLWGNVNPSFLTYPWSLVLVVNYLYLPAPEDGRNQNNENGGMHQHRRPSALLPMVHIINGLQAEDAHEMHQEKHEHPRGAHACKAHPSAEAFRRAILTDHTKEQGEHQHAREGYNVCRSVV